MPGVPVQIENDANLGALGEHRFGAGRDHRDLIYVKMGQRTIGAGLILDGRLIRGASGFAGELAHIHIDDDGALCVCGSRGCLSRRLAQTIIDAGQSAYDHPVNFAAIRDLAASGETGPMRVLRDLGRTVGRPMADLCTFLNPSAVLLDASLGAAAVPIADGIRDQIETYAAPAAAAAVRVAPGTLEDADAWGAVQLGRAGALRQLVTPPSPRGVPGPGCGLQHLVAVHLAERVGQQLNARAVGILQVAVDAVDRLLSLCMRTSKIHQDGSASYSGPR